MNLLPAGSFIDDHQRYEVVRLLGQGGMASVYEVRDLASSDRKSVAIKIASSTSADRSSAWSRLISEYEIARTFQSLHIVTVLERGETKSGVPYYTMEIVQGEPLASWIKERDLPATLPVGHLVKLLLQIAKAIQVIHDAGYVFVDLTPANIFVRDVEGDFAVTLIDFGLACKSVPLDTAVDPSASQHKSLVGTMTHLSPEQVRGDPLTNRTDIYAFGIVAYQLCTGQLPYQMDNPMALIANQAVAKTPSIRAKNPAIPKSLEIIVQVAMEKAPADRFADMAEVIHYLGKVTEKGWFARLVQGFRGVTG
ncbi:serine/threonine-protein kinase [Pirellulaceae bacterium SH449]